MISIQVVQLGNIVKCSQGFELTVQRQVPCRYILCAFAKALYDMQFVKSEDRVEQGLLH
jgi:hypothetical protein